MGKMGKIFIDGPKFLTQQSIDNVEKTQKK